MARMKLLMPKFGMTMTEGTIVEQFRNPGDRVAAGDKILSVETEKVVTEIEAPADGTIVEFVCRPGDDVPVGDVIAIIET